MRFRVGRADMYYGFVGHAEETSVVIFFCKQKTAYEMRISDWSSDVCSSDLIQRIFLDPETGKYRMKLMLGRPVQGAWQGGGQSTACLALAEGFETARAFTLLQGLPCWASLGARRLDQEIGRAACREKVCQYV